ncbi:hypothetical protein RMSM_04905 [Rhodopirellula maiorica SM1]|uniref:Uncharacterized protein n=1 Tax=Rhodopirellula maiorica SM1 TaxID=1265738 RepID=M5RFL0_9BACT|nr:hypothetical protein RMSM_04905 [Rhodopirellula maiorica SM1]
MVAVGWILTTATVRMTLTCFLGHDRARNSAGSVSQLVCSGKNRQKRR